MASLAALFARPSREPRLGGIAVTGRKQGRGTRGGGPLQEAASSKLQHGPLDRFDRQSTELPALVQPRNAGHTPCATRSAASLMIFPALFKTVIPSMSRMAGPRRHPSCLSPGTSTLVALRHVLAWLPAGPQGSGISLRISGDTVMILAWAPARSRKAAWVSAVSNSASALPNSQSKLIGKACGVG